MPCRHVQRPRRQRYDRLHLQRMVVDDREALRLDHVAGSELFPAQDIAQRQARAAPRDDVLRLGAVLPVVLEGLGRDRRSVLEDGVFTQLQGPDLERRVGADPRRDPGIDIAPLVDQERRTEHLRRERPVTAAVTPRGHRASHPAHGRNGLRRMQFGAGPHGCLPLLRGTTGSGSTLFRGLRGFGVRGRLGRQRRVGRPGRLRNTRCASGGLRSRRIGRRGRSLRLHRLRRFLRGACSHRYHCEDRREYQ